MQWFSRTFSQALDNRKAVVLFDGGSLVRNEGFLVKVAPTPKIARIYAGWPAFAAHAMLHVGATYVVRVRESGNKYRIRFFLVPPPAN